jgi:hypothetical protein
MFLEDIAAASNDYECKQKEGKSCDSCGNCSSGGYTPISKQECYFFLFDTMCGRSSLRCRFNGEPTKMEKMISNIDFYDGGTDNNVDFLFGFTGYDYKKLTDSDVFREKIAASIGAGKPVIAKVKTVSDRFRVITGYDGETLICPDYTNAQRKPESTLSYNELDTVYIIGDKITPRYTTLDGLKRIRKVMEYNISENLWGSYTEKMGLYTSDSLSRCNIEEKKARMKRVADTMWHTFNCHNFAETFRHKVWDGIDDPRFMNAFDIISSAYDNTHTRAWQVIALHECRDWSKRQYNELEWGMCGCVTDCLEAIRANDAAVLGAINEVIGILDKKVSVQ